MVIGGGEGEEKKKNDHSFILPNSNLKESVLSFLASCVKSSLKKNTDSKMECGSEEVKPGACQ